MKEKRKKNMNNLSLSQFATPKFRSGDYVEYIGRKFVILHLRDGRYYTEPSPYIDGIKRMDFDIKRFDEKAILLEQNGLEMEINRLAEKYSDNFIYCEGPCYNHIKHGDNVMIYNGLVFCSQQCLHSYLKVDKTKISFADFENKKLKRSTLHSIKNYNFHKRTLFEIPD